MQMVLKLLLQLIKEENKVHKQTINSIFMICKWIHSYFLSFQKNLFHFSLTVIEKIKSSLEYLALSIKTFLNQQNKDKKEKEKSKRNKIKKNKKKKKKKREKKMKMEKRAHFNFLLSLSHLKMESKSKTAMCLNQPWRQFLVIN